MSSKQYVVSQGQVVYDGVRCKWGERLPPLRPESERELLAQGVIAEECGVETYYSARRKGYMLNPLHGIQIKYVTGRLGLWSWGADPLCYIELAPGEPLRMTRDASDYTLECGRPIVDDAANTLLNTVQTILLDPSRDKYDRVIGVVKAIPDDDRVQVGNPYEVFRGVPNEELGLHRGVSLSEIAAVARKYEDNLPYVYPGGRVDVWSRDHLSPSVRDYFRGRLGRNDPWQSVYGGTT